MAGLRTLAVVLALIWSASAAFSQSGIPTTYHAIANRTVYTKPALPTLGAAGWRFSDPTFSSRMLRVTDGNTRPGSPGRSYSTPSAAHQLAWNATSDRFYVRSLDGWFIPYNFDPITMTASRIQPTPSGNGGLLVSSQVVEPQFSFLNRDVIFAAAPDTTAGDGINYPVIQKYDFASGQYSPLLNLRPYTTLDPCPDPNLVPSCYDTYAGALSSSATVPEKVSVMLNGRGQDRHYKVAVFEAAAPEPTLVILNTRTSQITQNGSTFSTSTPLGFLLHHAWIDKSGQWVVLYPVNALPWPFVVWNLATHTFTPVTTRPFGHDALGFGWQVNQDCCSSGGPWDAAQWQLRTLASPQTSSDLIGQRLSPQQPCLADHTSWNNAQPGSRVPVLSSLYRYTAFECPPPPAWRPWDDEIIAIQTSAPGAAAVWRFAHHRSNVTRDDTGTATYFWYQPHAVISPNGRWALFTSNWEKTLGLATGSEPEGRYRTDVFIVRLNAGAFTDATLTGQPVRAVHFTELRDRINLLRINHGLAAYPWTDPGLAPGVTVRAAHLLDLRTALQEAYLAAGQVPPAYSEFSIVARQTIIRASHIEELRSAVITLEGG